MTEREEGRLSTADLAAGATVDEATDRSSERSSASATDTEASEPLLTGEQADEFRSRWEAVQTGFVDEPRRAVEDADTLVAEVMQRLAETFAGERSNLEGQWDRGGDVSTEDLRVALQRYRSFFNRLLTT